MRRTLPSTAFAKAVTDSLLPASISYSSTLPAPAALQASATCYGKHISAVKTNPVCTSSTVWIQDSARKAATSWVKHYKKLRLLCVKLNAHLCQASL